MRRTKLSNLESLHGDDAMMFLCGLDAHKPVDTTEVVQFFAGWHVIHFLVSGTQWDASLPTGFIFGGENWIQFHPDHEPATILSVENTKIVANCLSGLSPQLLSERLQSLDSDSSEIYGAPIPQDEHESVLEAFQYIRNFIMTAADKDQVIVKSIG
jgi:Domain of unknown function (DUF1877)